MDVTSGLAGCLPTVCARVPVCVRERDKFITVESHIWYLNTGNDKLLFLLYVSFSLSNWSFSGCLYENKIN